jgi:Restriction endonuclease EcoRV
MVSRANVTKFEFLAALQNDIQQLNDVVSTDNGQWIIKGFIDVHQNIYTISIDTKIISKVLELLLFSWFEKFARKHQLRIELAGQQNFYPDLTLTDEAGNRFAVDIKSTYRDSADTVNGMTLGAFTGYFRNRKSNKNTLYPYDQYQAHIVLGVIYSQNQDAFDERQQYQLSDLQEIPSVIHSFEFFAQPKYRIASASPGSGNTKNIGSCLKIKDLLHGSGVFSQLGEDVYDDYWMYFLTADMAAKLETKRPYTNLKTYLEYKQKNITTLRQFDASGKR